MADRKQVDVIAIMAELERVDLSALILPLLKIVDPIAKVVPEGLVKQTLIHMRPYTGQFDFLDKVLPFVPGTIRVAGRIAAFRPVGLGLMLFGEGLSLFLRVSLPVAQRLVRLVRACIRALSGVRKGHSPTAGRT